MPRPDPSGSRGVGEGSWDAALAGDCGGSGRYSRSEPESASYSESVRSSGSSWKAGRAVSSGTGVVRMSMSLLTVTSRGGA